MPIFRKYNENFFKKWSAEMAYVLGLFAADGTMIRNNRGAHFIEFQLTDKDILRAIRKVLNSYHKIAVRRSHNPHWKTAYRLQIGSKTYFSDLLNLGFVPKKSKVLKYPHIPPAFFGHFVRGYFDGDGCVYFRKHWATDRKKMRWVFTSRFVSGSKKFLVGLLKALRKKGCRGGFILSKKGAYELVLSRADSVALFKLMYHNVSCHLYLHRKYKIYAKAIRILYGKIVKMRP